MKPLTAAGDTGRTLGRFPATLASIGNGARDMVAWASSTNRLVSTGVGSGFTLVV